MNTKTKTNETKKFRLKNLDCADCAVKIEDSLKKLDTVSFVSVNFATESLEIESDNLEEAIERIKKIEPEVEVIEMNGKNEEEEERTGFAEILKIGIPLILFFVGIILNRRLHETPYSIGEYLFFIPLYLYTGRRVLISAIRNIIRGNIFGESFLMMIATVGAIFIHALPEAVGVMLFFTVGEFFEDLALNRSRRSIKALLAIKPSQANLLEGNSLKTVPPETVKPGQLILVKPGERVPLDGRIVKGSSLVDTSALTGESVPRSMREGDTILSGMISQSGILTIEVEKPFNESSVYRILELVENAVQKKAKTEKFITNFSHYYTPAVVGLALLIAVVPPLLIPGALFSQWIYRALVLLVISCPCALVISIPLGYFGGIGAASRRGILIKGSNYLDTIARVKTMVFDKTGTLTQGSFEVTEIVPRNHFSEEELLKFAAMAENLSDHPIAKAIIAEYERKAQGAAKINMDDITVEKQEEIAGHGIKASIEGREIVAGNDKLLHREKIAHEDCELDKTVVYVAVDREYYGYIVISDRVKPESAKAISMLKSLGVTETVMLTGDNERSARVVAEELGVDRYYSGLLPEDKINILERIISENSKKGGQGSVAFVGDGINDAPVLARADVGIAMGELGSDAAVESADIVLMTDNPVKIPEVIVTGRRTKRIVWQNIVFALGVKFTFIAFGASGLPECGRQFLPMSEWPCSQYLTH